MSVVRGRPPGLAGGMSGSIKRYWSSLSAWPDPKSPTQARSAGAHIAASSPESPQDATITAAQPSSSHPADPFKTGCQFGLDLGDHLHHRPEPATLAQHLGPQAGSERLAIRRVQRPEARRPIAPGRLEVADALCHEQALDTTGVLAALNDEAGSLTGAASRILLLGRGHGHDAADLRLTALQRHQRAQEPGRIEAVRLGPPCPAIDQQAGCVQNPVLDAPR